MVRIRVVIDSIFIEKAKWDGCQKNIKTAKKNFLKCQIESIVKVRVKDSFFKFVFIGQINAKKSIKSSTDMKPKST